MKLAIVVAAFLPLVVGCGVDRKTGRVMTQNVAAEPQAVSHDTYALGTAVTALGAVPQDAAGETFIRGGEVFLSVDLSGTSTAPVVEVRWVDPAGEVIHRDVKSAPRGAHHLPFSSGHTEQWKPGSHRAVVLIDGRSVSEKRFTVM